MIRITVGTKKKGESGYHRTKIADGDLCVEMLELSNVSYIGNELVGTLGDASGLPLKSALDVKKYAEELSELLEKIKGTVGLASDCTIDNDLVAFDAIVNKAGYTNRLGEFQVDMVKALASNLENACKEELSKELRITKKNCLWFWFVLSVCRAIAEAWTTGVLRFEGVKTLKSGYHRFRRGKNKK